MKPRLAMQCIVSLATLLSLTSAMAEANGAGNTSSVLAWEAAPKVDARGYIDVWALRSDVAHVESLYATEDTERCDPEGDPDEQLSQRQMARRQREAAACEAKVVAAYKLYREEQQRLNRAWEPVLRAAMQKGDAVAEVILRQCETTVVLDRSNVESTCDQKPERRALAVRRLDAIGFLPATDNSEQVARDWSNPGAKPNQHEINQLAILKKVRGGALGYDESLVHGPGNQPSEKNLLENMRRALLLEAVREDVQRAFTYSSPVAEFRELRLVRKPALPRDLTFGDRHHGSSPSYWRVELVRESFRDYRDVVVGGFGDARFMKEREALLAEIDASIERYLKQEPRWRVFLLRRIGHHEWVPEGTESTTHKLDPAWLGKWTLVRETADWSSAMATREGTAEIYRDGEFYRITTAAASKYEPFIDVSRCRLRYSGGSTLLPPAKPEGDVGDAGDTLLGYMSHGPHPDAVAPFDVRKRYKQVLMQCPGAEESDSVRSRFLLLAGDTLVEMEIVPWQSQPSVRHYQRVKDEAPADSAVRP